MFKTFEIWKHGYNQNHYTNCGNEAGKEISDPKYFFTREYVKHKGEAAAPYNDNNTWIVKFA